MGENSEIISENYLSLLYRVIFSVPATSLATKGDAITFSSPTIEGTVFRRNKLDAESKHPWKAEVTEGDNGVSADIISKWFTAVYEPNFTPVTPLITITTQPVSLTEVTVGSVSGSLSVVAGSNTSNPVTYQWYKNTTDTAVGGTKLNGETSASFDIPTDLSAGTYYYYCSLSSSGATSVKSEVATVTVS